MGGDESLRGRQRHASFKRQLLPPACVGGAEASTAAATNVDPSAATFVYETETPLGHLRIAPARPVDVQPACAVMTRAFVSAQENLTLSGALAYSGQLMAQGPEKGALLVARLAPNDKSLLPPNQETRLAGSVTLSFHPDTMQPCVTLPPPSSPESPIAYLCNLVVDAKLRKQGIAKALIRASLALTTQHHPGLRTMYLHVRTSEEAVFKLYEGEGFVEVARDPADSMVLKMKGIAPRVLMKKDLR